MYGGETSWRIIFKMEKAGDCAESWFNHRQAFELPVNANPLKPSNMGTEAFQPPYFGRLRDQRTPQWAVYGGRSLRALH
jgi:hypothetical protein